eukprot:1491758-Rhodomonas_salina.1
MILPGVSAAVATDLRRRFGCCCKCLGGFFRAPKLRAGFPPVCVRKENARTRIRVRNGTGEKGGGEEGEVGEGEARG